VNDSAVLVEKGPEETTVPSTPARPEEKPIPLKKPRRFSASFRFNGLRYVLLFAALGLAFGLVRGAMWKGLESPESTFMLVLAGGLLAAAAKTVIDIFEWAKATQKVVHVERIRAVKRVFKRARKVREQAVIDWRRIHTVLVDNLTGASQEIRLFHDHDETDRQSECLFRKALSEEVWIRVDGVDAVRRFKQDIAALNYNQLATEAEFLAAFNGLMNRLRRDLAVASIGIPLD
jgi:hypothetical protein